jgi:hypothetical protein
MILTLKPLATNLEFQTCIEFQDKMIDMRRNKQPSTMKCTSPHGGQSPSQHLHLQACRP